MMYTVIALVAMCGVISLGVDYGRVQLFKNQLQTAADAAARAGCSALPLGPSEARARALTAASANTCNGIAVQLVSADDVELGTWNEATRTFTKLPTAFEDAANAVRIIARRTAARGNPIPLTLARVVGKNEIDISQTAIAGVTADRYAVVGLDWIKMSGNATDSYWATDGYDPTTATQKGSIASNGDITMSGNSLIKGDARPGIGKNVIMSGSATVEGSIIPLTSTLAFPAGSAGAYATSNDNWKLPAWSMTATSFHLGNNNVLSMPAGNYYLNNFTMTAGGELTLNGPTTIYVYGNLSISGRADTASNLPKNLKIVMVSSGTVNLSSMSAMYADIYAPLSAVTLGGGGDIYGSVLGKTIDMTGSSKIHYDRSLGLQVGKVGLVK